MNIVENFDAEKFYLGKLCKRGHEYQGIGKTLRLLPYRECLDCKQCRYHENREAILLQKTKYLVDNKEAINSRRRKAYQDQKEVVLQRNQDYRKEHSQRINERRRERYALDPTRAKVNDLRYRQANRLKRAERQRNYYRRNRAAIYERFKDYRRLHPEVFRLSSLRRRARKRSVHSVFYTPQELLERFNEFENSCAYCGSTGRLTIDHFIPISRGGSDNLGNIVPACLSCNCSKQDSDAKDWYLRQPFYHEQNWKSILKILGKNEATLSQIPLF